MRHFSGEFEGVRLLMSDELDLIAGGDGEDTDDVPPPKDLDPCTRNFLTNQLSSWGMPSNFLSSVVFKSGLDGTENWITSQAYGTGASAVTQGNTIYVRPEYFESFSNFTNQAGYEEVLHAAQFAQYGEAGFYALYGGASVMGWITGNGAYNGNSFEIQAKAFASALAGSSHSCP